MGIEDRSPFGDSPRLPELLLVAVLALGALGFNGFDPTLCGDWTRDTLRVQACLNPGITQTPCELEEPTRKAFLVHGPLWMRFLIATHQAGLSLAQQVALTDIMKAIACALVYRLARMRLKRSGAALACVVFLDFTIGVDANPSLVVLPAAIFFTSILALRSEGGGLLISLAGVALYFCADAHLAGLGLLPFFVGISVLGARRPLRNLAFAVASFGLPAVLFSRHAYSINLNPDGPALLPLTGAMVAVLSLALYARHRWREEIARRWFPVVIASSVAWFGSIAAVAALVKHWRMEIYYLYPVEPALTVLIAIGADRLGQWLVARHLPGKSIPAAIAYVMLFGNTVPEHFESRVFPNHLRYGDAEAVTRKLRGTGWSFARDADAMHGPWLRILDYHTIEAFGLFGAPAAAASGSPKPMRVVVVPSGWKETPPPEWQAVDVSEGRRVLLGPLKSWTSARPTGVWLDGALIDPNVAWPDRQGPDEMFSRYTYDRFFDPPHEVPWKTRKVVQEYRITPDGPGTHTFDVVDNYAGCEPGWAPWIIESIEGVAGDIAPDHRSVVIHSGGGPGVIRFEHTAVGVGEPKIAPIEFVETTDGEDAIRGLIRFRSFPLRTLCDAFKRLNMCECA